jgi:hypothetical protein
MLLSMSQIRLDKTSKGLTSCPPHYNIFKNPPTNITPFKLHLMEVAYGKSPDGIEAFMTGECKHSINHYSKKRRLKYNEVEYPLFESSEALSSYAKVNKITEYEAAIMFKVYQNYNITAYSHHMSERGKDWIPEYKKRADLKTNNPELYFDSEEELIAYANNNKINPFVAATLFRDDNTLVRQSRVERAFDIHQHEYKKRQAAGQLVKCFSNSTDLAIYSLNNYMDIETAATQSLGPSK